MNDDNAPTQATFDAALAQEFGFEQETPPTPPASTPEGGDNSTPPAAEAQVPPATPPVVEPVTPQAGVEKTDEEKAAEAQAELAKSETPEETAQRLAEEAAGEAPKYATAEDVKNAIRELNQETTQRVEQVHEAREEIISKMYPEGIDRNIYDTNGKVIQTAQDIVDRGLLKEDGEPYSYEEAASFVLEANRKMTENINELNNWAEQVAEQNISLVEGNRRVMAEWGDTLKAMPDVAAKLAETYITTQLQFDKTGSYITKMSMPPEQFYAAVMGPYKQLNASLAQQQAVQAEQEAQAQQQAQQSQQQERNGLPPQRGQSEIRANTGDSMLDALVDELNKG